MTVNPPIQAAQYLRMSTEHQQYSTDNQARAILQYANSHGFVITHTYSDAARSGLWLRNRPRLRELLRDVAVGNTPFRAILVYDVSRWGRFQDTDEAAHHEFLCKAAGIPVHYCAETFPNDGSMPSLIMKALKRVMAGEYSRELGTKVLAGQRRLAELGFKQGGEPGYGLRRLLVSADRKPKQLLVYGERKSIMTDRVVLVPGPAHEIECVRDIFRMFTTEKWTLRALARELNRRGIPYRNNGRWSRFVVGRMLANPNYVGCNVFSRVSERLGTQRVARPRSEWVVARGAYESIIDPSVFVKAQEVFDSFTSRKTDEQVLQSLRVLLASKGRLNTKIIRDAPGMVCLSTLRYRFGGIREAYKLIGYRQGCNVGGLPTTWALREDLLFRIQEKFPGEVSVVDGGKWRSRLELRNGLMVSVLVAPFSKRRGWRVEPSERECRSVTLLARMDKQNRKFHDLHVFPRLHSPKSYYLSLESQRLRTGTRLTDLSQFCDVVRQVRLAWKRQE